MAMDEFPEFDLRAIEALRQPLEDKKVDISRARSSITFPSDFLLVATMNPCPCGNRGSPKKECICAPYHIEKYERRLSGPIIDRIDMWIEVNEINYERLGNKSPEEDSQEIRKRIELARAFQLKRFKKSNLKIKTNSDISPQNIMTITKVKENAVDLLNKNSSRLNLSARSYHRIIRLSRTIADMKQKEEIDVEEILEALQYRLKDFKKD
jgi:magnesium chelatase family protein